MVAKKPQSKGRDRKGKFLPGVAPPTSGKFLPGKSGNPGGLPATVKAIRELALTHSPTALMRLVGIVENQFSDPSVVVRAAEAILDRAGLRPFSIEPERLEVTTRDGDLGTIILARLAALRIAGGAGRDRGPALAGAAAGPSEPPALAPTPGPADAGPGKPG
jgi:hypothetical protein